MKKLLMIMIALFSTPLLWAQDATNQGQGFWNDPLSHPLMPLYAIATLMFIVIGLITMVAITLLRVINALTKQVAVERAERAGVTYNAEPSLWKKLWQKINASVPVEQEGNIELDHNYDGIKELDNHLPPWWKWLLYGSIVWAFIYIIVFHFTDSLPLSEEEYQNEVAFAQEQQRKLQALKPKVEIDETTLTYSHDQAILQKGKEIYTINCSPCHKDNGGGSIGPNLTDDYWLHGSDVKNIYTIIKNGVPEKGMISWANVLSPEQIRDVSFFVLSINGTNPPGAKGPQGELQKVQLQGSKSDTVKVQASL